MERKRVVSGASPTGSLVSGWSFPCQPAQVLVVEALPPWWSSTSRVLCEALENVLSLASSLDGPTRIPLLTVYAISHQQECLLPFVPVRGNLLRLHSCVEELRSLSGEGCVRGAHTGALLMGQAVLDSLQQYKQYQRHTSTTSGTQAAQNNCSVEVTVVTSHPGPSTLRQLEVRLREADLVSLKRLLLVQILHSSSDWSQSNTPSEDTPQEASEDLCMLGAEIDLQQVDNSVFALETVLKNWLHEQGGDREHLHLLLPSPTGTPVCVKCDMQERLISPALLPLSTNLRVKTETTRDFLPGKSSANQSAAPQKLKAIRALRADGLCESLLYGLPLLLRPSLSWSLDWDYLETNHNLFHALGHALRSRGLFLLLQTDSSHKSAPGTATGVFSHYVLQPSPSLSLLLKPVVSRELLLPCSMGPSSKEPCPEAHRTVQACLGQLEEEFVFNPLLLNSNLYLHLQSRRLHSHSRYPYKAAPENPSQPLEGSKSTGSRQHRQGRQSAASSKARASVAPLHPSSALRASSRPALTLLSSGSRGPDRTTLAPCVSSMTDVNGETDLDPDVDIL